MASFTYTRAKQDMGRALIDFQEAGADIRVILVMTNSTADTEEDTATISAFSTLDEHDGSSYARQALALQTLVEITASDHARFDASDTVFSTLGIGTRNMLGVIVYRHVTNDADSVPIFWIDSNFGGATGTPSNGANVTLGWNSGGIAQLGQA